MGGQGKGKGKGKAGQVAWGWAPLMSSPPRSFHPVIRGKSPSWTSDKFVPASQKVVFRPPKQPPLFAGRETA